MSATALKAKTTDRSTLLAQERTSLAVERSRIAAERTLMAWIRTALSMIGFGFTIYKFFQYLRESNIGQASSPPHGPRNVGMGLILLGVAVLIAATLQHRQSMKRMSEMVGEQLPRSLALATAAVLAFGGLVMFFSLLFRFGPF
jgi:putative membrane protein